MLLRVAVALLFVGSISAFDLGLANLLAEKRALNQVCYQHPLDIAFILDASSSIWAQNFTKAKAFVNSFIQPYEIGAQKVRVALETYAHRVYDEDVIHFNDFLTSQSLRDKINSIVWHHGHRTETGLGIAYMREHIMTQARAGLPKICIVITDGESQEPEKTAHEAKLARADGIEMFAIGVSKAVRREELENIAGDADRVIIVETYSELEAIKDKLSGQTCKDVPTPPPTMPADNCGKATPTDVYYVMDPAHLGMERTNWVTQFITHTLSHEAFTHMKVGVISGSCPLDAGFNLNTYSTFNDVRTRLASYDSSKLPKLIGSLSNAYKRNQGGRRGAKKVAVIFIGAKFNDIAIIKNAEAAREAGVEIFFTGAGNAEPGLLAALKEIGFNLAQAGFGVRQQAATFVQQLCPN